MITVFYTYYIYIIASLQPEPSGRLQPFSHLVRALLLTAEHAAARVVQAVPVVYVLQALVAGPFELLHLYPKLKRNVELLLYHYTGIACFTALHHGSLQF